MNKKKKNKTIIMLCNVCKYIQLFTASLIRSLFKSRFQNDVKLKLKQFVIEKLKKFLHKTATGL